MTGRITQQGDAGSCVSRINSSVILRGILVETLASPSTNPPVKSVIETFGGKDKLSFSFFKIRERSKASLKRRQV